MSSDDIIPPVTTHTLDPSEPDGENGWYVSDLNVTLNATDDMSGVNHTYYNVNNGEWKIYTEHFTISEDGEYILIEYYSVDKSENIEKIKSVKIKIDQTGPVIDLTHDGAWGDAIHGWELYNRANATDFISGMERVEFYIESDHKGTIYGPGSDYECWCNFSFGFRLFGLIHNTEITEEFVYFDALIVILTGLPEFAFNIAEAYDNAGNSAWDGMGLGVGSPSHIDEIYLFQDITLPNNYTGYIGRYFIWAEFGQP